MTGGCSAVAHLCLPRRQHGRERLSRDRLRPLILCSVNTTQRFSSRDRSGSFAREDFLCVQIHNCSLRVELITAAVVVGVGRVVLGGQTRLHALWPTSTLGGMCAEVAWVDAGLDSALLPTLAQLGGHQTFTCHAIRSLSFSIFSWASGCSCRYRSVKKACGDRESHSARCSPDPRFCA